MNYSWRDLVESGFNWKSSFSAREADGNEKDFKEKTDSDKSDYAEQKEIHKKDFKEKMDKDEKNFKDKKDSEKWENCPSVCFGSNAHELDEMTIWER